MSAMTVEIPDAILSATRQGPEEFLHELRLTAAATWYSQGKISQEIAARVAELDRTDFLLALARMGVDSFPVNMRELEEEIRDV